MYADLRRARACMLCGMPASVCTSFCIHCLYTLFCHYSVCMHVCNACVILRTCRRTGNCGATQEYWYHRAVLVAWPKSMRLQVARAAGYPALLRLLSQTLRDPSWWRGQAKTEAEQPQPALLQPRPQSDQQLQVLPAQAQPAQTQAQQPEPQQPQQPQRPGTEARPASPLQPAASDPGTADNTAAAAAVTVTVTAVAAADAACEVVLTVTDTSQPPAKRQKTDSTTEPSPAAAQPHQLRPQPPQSLQLQPALAEPAQPAQLQPNPAVAQPQDTADDQATEALVLAATAVALAAAHDDPTLPQPQQGAVHAAVQLIDAAQLAAALAAMQPVNTQAAAQAQGSQAKAQQADSDDGYHDGDSECVSESPRSPSLERSPSHGDAAGLQDVWDAVLGVEAARQAQHVGAVTEVVKAVGRALKDKGCITSGDSYYSWRGRYVSLVLPLCCSHVPRYAGAQYMGTVLFLHG